MLHCDWSCESHQDGRNYEERRIWEGFNRKPQEVSSKMAQCRRFRHNKNPKHTSPLVKTHLQKTKLNVVDWPANSFDLNTTENLWSELKTKVSARRPSKNREMLLMSKQVVSVTLQSRAETT